MGTLELVWPPTHSRVPRSGDQVEFGGAVFQTLLVFLAVSKATLVGVAEGVPVRPLGLVVGETVQRAKFVHFYHVF